MRALLVRAGLPSDGLEEQFPDAFVVAERAGEVVGAAGLERYGAVGLLRSLVVAESERGAGIGDRLVRDRLRAGANRLERIFLLKTTAATYFDRFGFVKAPRSDAPPPLAASAEFSCACPASAACLVYVVPL